MRKEDLDFVATVPYIAFVAFIWTCSLVYHPIGWVGLLGNILQLAYIMLPDETDTNK